MKKGSRDVADTSLLALFGRERGGGWVAWGRPLKGWWFYKKQNYKKRRVG